MLYWVCFAGGFIVGVLFMHTMVLLDIWGYWESRPKDEEAD